MKPGQYRSGEAVTPSGTGGERTMETEPKRYVWLRKDWTISIIEDPVALLDSTQYPNFDPENDRIYELGAEVEVKVSVEVKKKTVYRGS